MNIVLTTVGMQSIMDAQQGGYKLELGTFRPYRSSQEEGLLPFPLTTAQLDANIINSWTARGTKLAAIDEFHSTAADVFHMVCTLPSSVGDFDFDAVAIYLANGVLLGVGCYERIFKKRKPADGVTANILEIEAFIRFASIADTIRVTRQTLKRPYSYIKEYSKADELGNVADNTDRIYRITRPTNSMGEGRNAFTTFLVHAGRASFDNQGKPYQKAVWVPSDHMAMFGSETLTTRLLTANTLAMRIGKDQFPMIEHIQTEIPYLVAVTALGNVEAPIALRGRLLEATLNVVAEGSNYYDIVLFLPNSTFNDATIRNVDFGAMLYASNTDLSAQEAVRVALRKFLEMQYAIGRTYKSDANTDPNDILMPYLGYRTYWTKLNGIVEASTSTTDGRLLSAGQIYDLPDYATGGETLLAPVLRGTNVWLRYDPASSGSVTYDVTADRTTVNEGGSVRYTLRTTGLANGALVAYQITGIQAADLSAGSLSGYFTVQNNVGVVDVTLNMDELTEGDEDMKLAIVANPSIFATVAVRDTSTALNVSAFVAVSPTANSGINTMNEGETRYFVGICGGVPDGTYLYPTLLQSSTASIYDLSQTLPSSVRVAEGRVSFPISAVNDRVTEGDELLSIGLYRDAQFTESLVSASVTIRDTSRASTINSYFSTKADGSDNINGNTIDEGAYTYLVIETTGYDANTQFNLSYRNSSTPSSVEVEDKDFSTPRPATATLDANGRAVIAYALASDFASDRELASELETFNVEVVNPTLGTVLSRSTVYVRDVSRTASGAYTISDITDLNNVFPVYNSSADKIAPIDATLSDNGTGPRNASNIALACTPLDIGLVGGRRYRLTWIQSPTASSAVTRVIATITSGNGIAATGVGLGTTDLNSATSGKALSMIKDSNGVTLGYGAVFEFQITNSNIAQRYPVSIYTYYPDGAPGLTGAPTKPSDRWSLAGQQFIPMRSANNQAYIVNDYDPSGATDPRYGMLSKAVHVPFGGYVDLLVISPSGAGGSSSSATSGRGADGENGRTLLINIPQYLGRAILDSERPKTDGVSQPYVWKFSNLWKSLITIAGGKGGKGQGFDEALTTLGGTAGTMTLSPTLAADLQSLNTGKLFARVDNEDLQYEVICEVVREVSGKAYQTGRSTNANQKGGLGFLPQGSLNNAENIRGAGGNGGASVGTGYGYGGGGGSGSIYVLRLGTRVLTPDFVPNPKFAPVTFYLTDAVALDLPNTDPIDVRIPFTKASTLSVIGGNTGGLGSELFVSQLDYRADSNKSLRQEALVGGGTPKVFARPTRNSITVPTLPLKEQEVWDDSQFNQITIPKYGVSRIVLLPTGVEGSYTDATDEIVLGNSSKPTNLLMYQTLNPDTTTPNETFGSTFVYVASAAPNTESSPVLTRTKLASLLNTSVLTAKVSTGDVALDEGSNTYSLGGLVDMFISNNSTTSKTFIAELPRVNLSDDNPAKVIDETEYAGENTWSTELDEDGNSTSSHGFKLAEGDGALAVQPYLLSTLIRLRPWIKLDYKAVSMNDTDAPIILQQGQVVQLTIVGGGGAVSTREPDEEVIASDPDFKGSALTLSIKSLTNETLTPFLVCGGGTGSIDNSTNPVPSASVATFMPEVIENCLRVVGTPVLTDGDNNPIKATHGGSGSGAYARVTLMNYYPHPVMIKASGGKGGSGSEAIDSTDGVVLITLL